MRQANRDVAPEQSSRGKNGSRVGPIRKQPLASQRNPAKETHSHAFFLITWCFHKSHGYLSTMILKMKALNSMRNRKISVYHIIFASLLWTLERITVLKLLLFILSPPSKCIFIHIPYGGK